MTKTSLKEFVSDKIAWVLFEKKDGTQREMFCTLQPALVPVYEKKTDRVKEPKENLLSVWDLVQDGFRTINTEKVLDYSEATLRIESVSE